MYEVFKDEKEFEKKLRRWVTFYVNGLIEKEREDSISEGTEDSFDNTVLESMSTADTNRDKTDVAKFLSEITDTVNDELWTSFSASDVAYFKLLAISLNKGGNDQTFLEAHDANLIYLNEKKYNFDNRLELNLVRAGLNGYGNQNIPLWKWLSLEPHRLKFYSMYFNDKVKAKFIDAITFLSIKSHVLGDETISEWFDVSESDEVRISAIKYLAKLGGSENVDLLMMEYERKNNRTLNASLEGIVAIKFRESVSKGFDAILELQPTILNKKIIKELNESGSGIESKRLFIGLECNNQEVRLSCLELLISRNNLFDDKAEVLLEHDDVRIRLRVLVYLSHKNKMYYKAKGEEILKLPKDTNNKDKYFDEYSSLSIQYENIEVLNKKLTTEFLIDAKVLIALAYKDKKNYLGTIRAYLNDKCDSFYLERLKVILPPGSSDSPFITGEIRGFITNNMLSDCVNWLASCMLKEDIELIRRTVNGGTVTVYKPVFDYFKRYGEWEDIYLLNEAKVTNNQTLLGSFLENEDVYEDLTEVYLKIAKGREEELIFTPINNSSKYRVITKVSIRAFSDLNDSQVIELLNDSHHLIREKTALRVIESFSKERIKKLLEAVTTGTTYFYNVVHWLDLGMAVKQSVYQSAVKQILRD
ncbi:hypothetical protein [Pantoea sp. DY-5]|uniref:hypothetical protein n=1 Tax=Pantoea sp. DY-5 TaxID=2871488 RepID=UPI001C96CCE1|nr:hypothetical protein [Pantoea sp. DY-5]MBY4838557.1 hypothetical protein [Pantoea sp. DY-5]